MIDGGARDIDYILKLGFPVFCCYRTPRDIVGWWEAERLCRNVEGKAPRYYEVFIDEGGVGVVQALRIYLKNGFDGVMIPDHTPQQELRGFPGMREWPTRWSTCAGSSRPSRDKASQADEQSNKRLEPWFLEA